MSALEDDWLENSELVKFVENAGKLQQVVERAGSNRNAITGLWMSVGSNKGLVAGGHSSVCGGHRTTICNNNNIVIIILRCCIELLL